jgi:hypothetical protein
MFLTGKSLSLAALCCLGIASAVAQEVPQTIVDCVDLKRDAARLACFDREVAQLTQRPAGVASTPIAPTPPAPIATPVAPTPQPSAAVKNDDFGMSGDLARKRAATQKDVEKPAESIEATLTKVTAKPYGELVFELDNGQVWQQLEAKKNFEIKEGTKVRIKKGAMGSFFLIADSGIATRAKRVR